MKSTSVFAVLLLAVVAAATSCLSSSNGRSGPGGAVTDSAADPELAAFIDAIRAIDNHAHPNTVVAEDSESDALPLEALGPFELPDRLRPDHPEWIRARQALYAYPHSDLIEGHLEELRAAMRRVAKGEGERFPLWVLDRVGTEIMLANRVAMGPGLSPSRFRWVSFADALMLPLSTAAERAASPDRQKFFPFEERLLRRYLSHLRMETVPVTLGEYLRQVVIPTLEAQRKAGAVAVKFEAAFLRSLDVDDVSEEAATKVYARYARGGEPPQAEYKLLQDFLFRAIAREAGRLGMAVHIHCFNGPGNFYRASGSDPLLLESTFNDPTLKDTRFVLIHGGGDHATHTGMMLWKPNVYADISALTLIHTPARLAEVLRPWLLQFPGKVLFGSDAATLGPEAGWELAAWVATRTGRQALALCLTEMLEKGEVSRSRAREIATMVMRTNAAKLYGLPLP
jgi:predicted TIM-barrel fold metal-dependent hydrolase